MRDVSVSGVPTGIKALEAKMSEMAAKVAPKPVHKISKHPHPSHDKKSSSVDNKKAAASIRV
jgi:hypothetical protein